MKIRFKSSKAELDRISCSTDASCIEGNARAVFFPESVGELANVVRQNPNIVIRGGGTGLVGGCVPLNDSVIDVSKMNKILQIDKIRRTVDVEAGIILDELQQELAKHCLEFPVQPSSHAVCTIGGMIATNAVGSRGIKYGRTQNWVEEAEVMDFRGEIKKVGKVDLSDYVGMEGITGIILKAKLKLIEKRNRTASLLKFENIENMVEIVKKLKLDNDVSMIEFFGRKIAQLLDLEEAYYLVVEYESEKGSLRRENYEEIIKMRDSIYPLLAGQGFIKIEDPQLYISKIAEFLVWLEQKDIPSFGHLGTGIIHACFKENDEGRIKDMLFFVKKLHGKISGEHGIGLRKREFIDESDKRIISKIKKRLDPVFKFNRNKIISSGENQNIVKDKQKVEESKVVEQQDKQEDKVKESKVVEQQDKQEDKVKESKAVDKEIRQENQEDKGSFADGIIKIESGEKNDN